MLEAAAGVDQERERNARSAVAEEEGKWMSAREENMVREESGGCRLCGIAAEWRDTTGCESASGVDEVRLTSSPGWRNSDRGTARRCVEGAADEQVVGIEQVDAVSGKRVVVRRLVDNTVAARLRCAEQLTDNRTERNNRGGGTEKERLTRWETKTVDKE